MVSLPSETADCVDAVQEINSAADMLLSRLRAVSASKKEDEIVACTIEAWKRSSRTVGMAPVVPLLFQLKGKPYTLTTGHFPMEPLFQTYEVPRRQLLKCGRQVSKSTTLAYQGLTHSIVQPFLQTLYVTPLYEQVRRFSQNYMKQAVTTCRIRNEIMQKGAQESVLQRGLTNGSNMFFSFAFRDCERTRGINADIVKYDEVQGIDKTFVPVIREAMSASPFRLEQYSGTPMTMDNTIEDLWSESSMAEWKIPCRHCGKENIAAHRWDLMKMIGKWDPHARTGLICAKCGKPLYTRDGNWWHEQNHLRHIFVGYHAPQVIFPMHSEDEERWLDLLHKRETTDEYTFMTECLGESWDAGAKLVTLSELRDACDLRTVRDKPWENDLEFCMRELDAQRHVERVLSIDWSGGGAKEESQTAMSVLGLLPTGDIEVLLMLVYPHRTDWRQDARIAYELFKKLICHRLVHDFGGAGAGREQVLVHSGFPLDKIDPITYVRASGNKSMMTFTPPVNQNVRHSWSLDKARSLLFTCEMIRQRMVHFPQWETCDQPLRHFLALVEETLVTPRGSDVHLIGKAQGVPDDCAHSINIGICSMFNRQGNWPDLVKNLRNTDGSAAGLSDNVLLEAEGGEAVAAEIAKMIRSQQG